MIFLIKFNFKMFREDENILRELLIKGTSIERICSLYRDLWQFRFDSKMLSLAHDIMISQNIDIDAWDQEIMDFIDVFCEQRDRCINTFNFPEQFIRTLRIMELLFISAFDDTLGFRNAQNRTSIYLILQARSVSAEYFYRRSWILANIGSWRREMVHSQYLQDYSYKQVYLRY